MYIERLWFRDFIELGYSFYIGILCLVGFRGKSRLGLVGFRFFSCCFCFWEEVIFGFGSGCRWGLVGVGRVSAWTFGFVIVYFGITRLGYYVGFERFSNYVLCRVGVRERRGKVVLAEGEGEVRGGVLVF